MSKDNGSICRPMKFKMQENTDLFINDEVNIKYTDKINQVTF